MTSELQWQRPHPLTVIVLIASFAASNAWPIVFVVIAGGGGIGFDTIALVLGGVTVGWGALGWYMTGYAITDEAVEYRSGVVNRQARSVPLDRIQQVSVAEPVLARAVGLAVVQVSEASADGDIEIRYLGLSVANELTEQLRRLARTRAVAMAPAAEGAGSLAPPPLPPPRPATRIHATKIRDLVVYQLAVVAPVLILAAAIAAIVGIAAAVEAGRDAALVAFGIGLFIVVLVPVVVVAGAVLQFGNFTLDRGAQTLTTDSGLLSRRQVEVRPDRIQTITVSSGPIARRFGLHEIKFSAATGKATKEQQAMVHLAPAVHTDDVAGLVQGSVDVDAGFGVALEPVSRLTVRRFLIRTGLLFLVVGAPAAIAFGFVHPLLAVTFVVAWWTVAVWFARARHARLGLSLDDNRLVARRGVLQHQLTQLPLANVQSVTTSTSFFQRRLGLAHLHVSTAGIGPSHAVVIPDLEVGRAEALRIRLGERAASSRWELRT